MIGSRSAGQASARAAAAVSSSPDGAATGASTVGAGDTEARVRRAVPIAQPAFSELVARAAERFRSSGRGPYYFARGKLGGDPVFAALLRDGRIASGARIVDVGCGLGVLAALLASAEQCDPSTSDWPQTWAPPPLHWTLLGFDLRTRAIAAAQSALSDRGARVSFTVGDVRRMALPASDVVVMLDVLHYIGHDDQRVVLTTVFEALPAGGTLLLRVGDAAPNWRFRWTAAVDACVTLARGSWPRFHFRPLAAWQSLLESIGFACVAQPMSEGTAFANVLLIATKPEPVLGRTSQP